MATFTHNGASIYYQVTGTGLPLIFTHGASWNHLQWEKQVEVFKQNYTVITWDVRGHGRSTLPPGNVHANDFSGDVIALMNHLNISQAILAGLSMGGHISLQTAIRFPNRVKALILIGTPCTNAFNFYEKAAVPVNRFISKWMPMNWSATIQAKMLSTFNPSNKAYIIEAFSQLNRRDWNRVWDAVTRMESKNDLHRVTCPTLLLIGDHDTMTKRQQPYMHQNIPTSELRTIAQAHHATNLDNPQDVNKEIEQFLKRLNV